MKKPEELLELLDTLKEEGDDTSVVADDDADATVYIGNKELHLSKANCLLLFNTEDTVQQFFEAIGHPHDAALELSGLELQEDVKSALEGCFSTVDEL